MKSTLSLLITLFIGAFLSGCTNRAPSLRMLDSRADYEDVRAAQDLRMREAGIDGFRQGPVPVRTRPKVASVWIHPHETASRDYFWGGWMSLVVEGDRWLLTKPGELPPSPALIDVTAGGLPSKRKKGSAMGARPQSR